jgi:deoxyribonuclease-4
LEKGTPIGFHLSIAGGAHMAVERAVELGCTALQIFGRNPRSWASKARGGEENGLFKEARAGAGIWPVAIHTTYLINLSSPDPALFDKSVKLLCDELSIADALGADYLVTHLGSSKGTGPEAALKRISKALASVHKAGLGVSTMLLFENSAGGGDTYGVNLAEIGAAITFADSIGLKTGFCYDTCHGFAAGYMLGTDADAAALAERMEAEVGLKSLKLIHLNDSKGEFGSRVDRHEHLGKGRIGSKGLRAFFKRAEFASVPVIMETPKNDDGDEISNLRTARKLMKN